MYGNTIKNVLKARSNLYYSAVFRKKSEEEKINYSKCRVELRYLQLQFDYEPVALIR
jgi:hypothetical protein